jgi:FlaA1/EpsC-like NDP-sugar epimerase
VSPARADPARRRARWRRVEHGLDRLRPWRQPLTLAIDALVVVVAWQLTYLFRLGFERWWSARADYDGGVLAGVVAVYLVAFVVAGVPRGLWRFSGFGELRRIALACLAAGACAALAVRAAELVQIPRAVLALHPFVTLVGIALLRLAFRMLHEHLREQLAADGGAPRRALVLGAGEAARLLLAGIHRQGWTVLGLLDDDPAKHGARIAGVPVLGPLAALAGHARRSGATQLIYAMPAVRGARRREVFALAAATGLPLLTVPSAAELRAGRAVERLRDVRAEDLLGRDPVQLDEAGLREALAGRTVLVTGAGGSIGSELCRQIARHAPARLLLFELAEYNLYAIAQELAEQHPALACVPLIGDVRDLAALRALAARWRPQVVFHAAAYKHVPLMEDEANAWACVRNNVLGTCHAALAASEAGCERFVLVSTDKAVQPRSVMGASKRAAERVVATLAQRQPGTRFLAVRFGNVLDSSGSVVPKFKQQIERGGPVTVTHPDVIRYFMTIPEAVQLVLQAATVGASGQVLVLDMGEPVRIVDLARQLIALAGRGDDEIAIEYTGLRAGEKLSEALLADADETLPTTAPRVLRVRLATPALDLDALRAALAATTPPAPDAARALLAQWVPEYAAAAPAQRPGSKR